MGFITILVKIFLVFNWPTKLHTYNWQTLLMVVRLLFILYQVPGKWTDIIRLSSLSMRTSSHLRCRREESPKWALRMSRLHWTLCGMWPVLGVRMLEAESYSESSLQISYLETKPMWNKGENQRLGGGGRITSRQWFPARWCILRW